MKRRDIALLLSVMVLLLIASSSVAADSVRQRLTMDFDWKFFLADTVDAKNAAFDDTAWRSVDLPHDWSIYGSFDQKAPAAGNGAYLPTGVGWYRKTFTLPDADKGRHVAIEFDGIYENSEVWINDHLLGERPYGYISFVYDLTPYLRFDGQKNVIAVRVDNSPQPNSRWYSGSGIYRHTWLLVTNDLHIPQWGTYVTTPKIVDTSATLQATVRVINQGKNAAQFELNYLVLDKDGHAVQSARGQGELESGAQKEFTQVMQIEKPILWSTETPSLYTLRCQVLKDGKLIDQYDTPFGVRSAVFDVNKGFLLNGSQIKMHGVCLHGDGGGVGTAVPEGVWARRLQLLKDMGCNAIRTSHNPPDPEFLDLCDKMGFLVMDEAFDEWEYAKRQKAYHLHFDDWAQTDLLDFIRRDRNHPSVVIWSAGNEIGEQVDPIGATILKRLVDTFHREDPTRPVTAACDSMSAEPKKTTLAFASLLDVVGYNYVDRWREHADTYYSEDRRAFPNRKFIGTESSSMSGTRGDYGWLFPPKTPTPPSTQPHYLRPPLNNVDIDVEQLWKFVRTYDYVSGDFMWTGFDYLGEAYWPNKVATFGPLDTCGFKKDGFYFYQSQWTQTPVLHLFPHWNWHGHEGETIPVTCYTNFDTVELFLNGKSLGVKGYEFQRQGMELKYGIYPPRAALVRTTADLHLSWDVPYERGTLKAVGVMADGRTMTEEISTTGEPAAIGLSTDKLVLTADRRDVAHCTVRILDAQGRVVPVADNDITFKVSGPANLISVDNGNPASDEGFKTNHRKAFNGLCLAIVQTTQDAGPIHITATSPGLVDASVTVAARSPTTMP